MKLRMFMFLMIGIFISFSSAFSAVYHIDPGASSSGNGSAASPFKSWSNLPTMKTGDDVYFKCGTTFTPQYSVSINWGGTAENPAVVGAYYINSANSPVYEVSGDRPIISGSGYTVPSNLCVGGSRHSWGGLIDVRGSNYVHIRNLHIFKSGFYGINFGGTSSGQENTNFWIDNVKIEGSYLTGISIDKSSYNYGKITNCEVVYANAGYGQLKNQSGARCESDWGAGIAVTNSPYAYTTISNNYVHEQWGEGISSTRINTGSKSNNCGYVTIEDNLVWNNRRVDVYLNLTEGNTVRRNILLGKSDGTFASTYVDGRPWNQCGIWVNNEERSDPLPNANHDNEVYSNFVAGHYSGVGLSSIYSSGTMQNNVFYNNTTIANYVNFSIGKNLSGYSTKGIVFKNNISYCPADANCSDVGSDPSWFDSKIVADYNAWSTKPKYWGGANDRLTNNEWNKTTGWQALNSVPDPTDCLPKSGNPVVGNGATLAAPYDLIISARSTKFIFLPLNILVAKISQKDTNSAWDMGAIRYYEKSKLSAPNLSIIKNQ